MSVDPVSRHDVVVVGARCAGAATAMLLAREGLDVLVLDSARHGSDTLSTHALMRGGVVQLRRWGLLDAVIAGGTPAITRTDFAYSDGVEASVDIAGTALRAPRRTVLDPLLADAARAAGADVRHTATVRRLLRNTAGRVTGVDWFDKTTGTRHAAQAALVVGADGRRSVVARDAAAPATRLGRHSGATVVGYWRGLPDEAYRWCYAPGTTAGVIPTNEGLACVWAGIPSRRFASEPHPDLEQYLRSLLAEAAPDLTLSGPARGPVRAHPGEPGWLRRPHGDGWALVGDAGYCKDPTTAHGITDALRDAELLAQAVLDGGLRRPGALRGYEETRDRLSHDLFDLTDRIASYNWTLPEVRDLLMSLSRAMRPEVTYLDNLSPTTTRAA